MLSINCKRKLEKVARECCKRREFISKFGIPTTATTTLFGEKKYLVKQLGLIDSTNKYTDKDEWHDKTT